MMTGQQDPLPVQWKAAFADQDSKAPAEMHKQIRRVLLDVFPVDKRYYITISTAV